MSWRGHQDSGIEYEQNLAYLPCSVVILEAESDGVRQQLEWSTVRSQFVADGGRPLRFPDVDLTLDSESFR